MTSPTRPATDVPAEIRAELARRGWSIRHLAAATGLAYATLIRRLDGDGRLSVGELSAVCDAFGITVSTLVARAEEVAA